MLGSMGSYMETSTEPKATNVIKVAVDWKNDEIKIDKFCGKEGICLVRSKD